MVSPNPAHRGDPTWLADACRKFGVTVKELEGWLQRGHGDFGNIQGIIIHHIGSNRYDAWNIARHPSLGLCSQIHLSREGVATMCGVGIAWHAGSGWYNKWPTNNANRVSIGIEAESDGVTAWPVIQMDAYHRICAAILWYLGKRATPETLLAHWEYSGKAQGKWDPGAGIGRAPRNGDDKAAMLDMNIFRARVNHYIDNPPFEKKAPTSTEVIPVSSTEKFKSRVSGSTYTGSALDFLLNADAHAFVSRANTEQLKKEVTALKNELAELRKGVGAILTAIKENA